MPEAVEAVLRVCATVGASLALLPQLVTLISAVTEAEECRSMRCPKL